METSSGGRQGKRPESGRASGRARATSGDSEQQYDLLTAALLGALVGASATFLLSRGSKHPAGPAVRAAARGAKLARDARRDVRRGVKQVGRGIHDQYDDIRDYVADAQSRINGLLASELKDLRRAVARQRKRAGL